jgi:hypothetical protein
MQTQPTEPLKASEEMQRQAKICETIAQDKKEEALTGDASEREMNEQDAKEWMVKSKVWLKAEAIVRGPV